jgi:hypothetical protein
MTIQPDIIPDNPYPHVLVWDRMNRKGQACRILAMQGKLTQVQFEIDGFTALVDRRALRRKNDCRSEDNSPRMV